METFPFQGIILDTITDRRLPERQFNIFLYNRTFVLYTGIMKVKRTTQTVQKSIAAFFRQQRRMPSYQEMLDLLGVKSKSVVNFWINKLIDANLLEKDNKGHLSFTKNAFAIPLIGSIQAGFPSPEEEALRDVISMDEYLITRPATLSLPKWMANGP
jgi:SOS-response transcriptional repressor LexA